MLGWFYVVCIHYIVAFVCIACGANRTGYFGHFEPGNACHCRQTIRFAWHLSRLSDAASYRASLRPGEMDWYGLHSVDAYQNVIEEP